MHVLIFQSDAFHLTLAGLDAALFCSIYLWLNRKYKQESCLAQEKVEK